MNVVTPTKHGPMIVNDNDYYLGRMLMKYGEFSESEQAVFKDVIQPGMIVCDVGANIGAHTVLFARLASRVFAFEPQKQLFNMLCGNLALNNIKNVECYRVAVGAENGEIPYIDINMDQVANFGGASLQDIAGMETDDAVPVVKLTTPCHFLKIDVEGMELDVLKGASDMIGMCQPVIYVENDRADKSDALIAYIYEIGYTPYWHGALLFNPNNFNGDSEDIHNGIASINMLCFPSSTQIAGLDKAVPGDWHERWGMPSEFAS